MNVTTNRRLLVVDDDPPQRYLARLALEAAFPDVSVDEASDGPSAIEFLENVPPHDDLFLVVDRNMPGMGGEEVLRHALAAGADGTLWTSDPTDCGLPCVAKPTDWRDWSVALADAVGSWGLAVA